MNNTSLPNKPQPQNQGMEVMSKLLPIAIAITLTNGLVFVLFYKRKSLRTSSNIFLLGLSVCDFITGAVNIPYFIIFSFNVVPRTSPMFKDFAYWMYILHLLMSVSAAYHILIITAEKYLAITKPLKHHLVSKRTVFKLLVGIWMVAGFIATIPFAWRKSRSALWGVIHSASCLVIVFLFPYVFMVYAYTVMFKAVSGRKRPSRHDDRRRLQKKNSNDRKCIIVFASMAAIYLCCWFPYFSITLVINVKFYTKSSDLAAVYKAVEPIAITRYLTSAINPLLYTFFKRNFWLALRSLFVGKRKSPFASQRRSTLRSFSFTYISLKHRQRTIKRAGSPDNNKNTRLSVRPELSPNVGSEETNETSLI